MNENNYSQSNINIYLKRFFGFTNLRIGQLEVIQQILNGKDVFACMATGFGKSLCYQLAGIMLKGIAIVVCPMISLQQDQVNSLNKINIKATYINSELDFSTICNIKADIQNNKYKFLYLSPEKLLSDSIKEFLLTIDISIIAVDEAHCISQWGHDFRPSYRDIPKIRTFLSKPTMVAFTATATQDVCNDIISCLSLRDPFIYIGGSNRPNLEYKVVSKHTNSELQLVSILKQQLCQSPGTIIVYVCKKATICHLQQFLQSHNVKTVCYHGSMTKNDKDESFHQFMSSSADVILATIAFGMGIDKSNVRFVIHYDMPNSIDNYLQETGRAGRDGMKSTCILLFSKQESNKKHYFLKNEQKAKYKQMINYCNSKLCRRAFLEEYTQANKNYLCNANIDNVNCDVCMECDAKNVQPYSVITKTNSPQKKPTSNVSVICTKIHNKKSPISKTKKDPIQLFQNGVSIIDCALYTKLTEQSIIQKILNSIIQKDTTDAHLEKHVSLDSQLLLKTNINKYGENNLLKIVQESHVDWNIAKLFVELNAIQT